MVKIIDEYNVEQLKVLKDSLVLYKTKIKELLDREFENEVLKFLFEPVREQYERDCDIVDNLYQNVIKQLDILSRDSKLNQDNREDTEELDTQKDSDFSKLFLDIELCIKNYPKKSSNAIGHFGQHKFVYGGETYQISGEIKKLH